MHSSSLATQNTHVHAHLRALHADTKQQLISIVPHVVWHMISRQHIGGWSYFKLCATLPVKQGKWERLLRRCHPHSRHPARIDQHSATCSATHDQRAAYCATCGVTHDLARQHIGEWSYFKLCATLPVQQCQRQPLPLLLPRESPQP